MTNQVLRGYSQTAKQPLRAAGALLGLTLCFIDLGYSQQAQAQMQEHIYSGNLNFNLKRVPFSRFGSYLSISDLGQYQQPLRKSGVYLRTMHGGGKDAFRLELLHDNQPVPFTTIATPKVLTFSSTFGRVEIVFSGKDSLRIRGRGVNFRCTTEDGWTVPYPNQSYEINTDAMKYMFQPVTGKVEIAEATNSKGGQKPAIISRSTPEGGFELEIEAYTSGWLAHPLGKNFDQIEQDVSADYAAWLRKMPSVPARLGTGAELAAYVNWESVVDPSGNLKRPAMLMSKNWMGSVWSWDQTFNAMATATGGDQKLAWDQYMLPFDIQDVFGDLADKWDSDSIAWEFSKPPVHGWALAWMLRKGYVRDRQQLQEIYTPLSKWTEWYFVYRDTNRNGFPEYRHGNESGWDNSTVFVGGQPVETPDLCAYLVLQMETLADLATRLGKSDDARMWRERSEQLLSSTIGRFWKDHRFVAYGAQDGKEIDSQSLLLLMPIVLGHRLPPQVRTALVADLKQRLAQSPYGIPTEPTDSSLYTEDGYWRGPIWAPSTMLIVEGLDDMGEHALAKQLRDKFCAMAQESGMAENFDASNGHALRDPAYTWTSSVFLLFAHDLL